MNKIELLAPAGNMDAAKAAILSGANAIYCGLKNFGARSFASNFSHEEMNELVSFAHLHNVKVYVTMNTLLNEYEIENAIKEVDFLYHADVDALLIQDLGLINLVSKCYPDFEIHASTQLHVHNEQGVKNLIQLGLKRIVLARETPIDLIRKCCKLDAEIEVFAYGALCVSYSGQCLMSSLTQNRSGNKGMCAQSCRMKYDVYENENEVLHQTYPLSPKDLNIIDHIPELIEAGVASLKIEGRMKRPEYVALVTSIFRKAIDAYYNHEHFVLSKEDSKNLKLMFNREFSEGLIFDNDYDQLFNPKRPNHVGIPLGKVVRFRKNRIIVKLSEDLNQGDGIRFIQENDEGMVANYIYKKGLLVNKAYKNDEIELDCSFYVDSKAQIVKTTDVKLMDNINKTLLQDHYKLPLTMYYEARLNKPFVLTLISNDETVSIKSDWLLEAPKKAGTSASRIEEQLRKVGNYTYECITCEGYADEVFVPISLLNHLRNEALNLLNEKVKIRHKDRTNKKEYTISITPKENIGNLIEIHTHEQYESLKNLNIPLFSNNKQLYENNDSIYPITDVVNEQSIYPNKEYVKVSDIGGIHLNTYKIASRTLNVSNSYALDFLYEHGFSLIETSYELHDEMIEIMTNSFIERNGFKPNLIQLTYGSPDLMVIKGHFVKKSCNRLKDYQNNMISYYRDHNDIAHLTFEKNCYKNQICDNIILRFINENQKEVERVLKENL